MNTALDDTLDPDLTSWVESANDPQSDFPIQNLPYGRFKLEGDADWRIGVAIGNFVIDLNALPGMSFASMNAFMASPADVRHAVRAALSSGLRHGSHHESAFRKALYPCSDVELGVPCKIGDYTDFYAGIHHATTVGKLFRPDNPLLPNYKWVPIGYHGRASSIGASGQCFRRPQGQIKSPDQAEPTLALSRRVDYELEVGIVIGAPNSPGEPISIEAAESHIAGLTLLNDWSARDIQAWEYQPLGPFLSKNFATTVSPWIVSLEALKPFRRPFQRPAGDPSPLPYLDSKTNRSAGGIDITLEAWLQTAAMRNAGLPAQLISCANLQDAYWTVAQLVTHHTVNGCNLQTGDLLGSGTISGPAPEQGGSLLELTLGGKNPLSLPGGESRMFLEDGDTVILRAYCERPGYRRIGFGECIGTVQSHTRPHT